MSGAKLGTLDIVLLVGSMVTSAIIGLYFTNKNKSIDAYMLGDRRMSVIPVAISLMTSCLSGLTLLGSSAEFYYQGPTYSFVVIPMLLCGPITAYTMLPVFYRLNELSLYKYLHKRYGALVKYIVTIVYIMQMVFYNSVVLYLPSMALQSIFGVTRFYSVLIIGLMCVFYSGIGGIKAVVWTDFFQAMMMYAAIIVVGALGTYDAGGVGQVFQHALEGGRMNLDGFWSLDLTTRHTFFGILFGSTIKHIYLVGINQVQIQRALSLPSLRQSQWAFILCSIFGALIILLSSYLGAVLVSAYRSCDPFLADEIHRRDAIIVHYVANRLAKIPGLRGIFIAGIFSATLSTLSSFANSMAALTLEDFIKPILARINHKELTGNTPTRLAKLLSILFGLVCIAMAFVVDKANSRLLQATTTMFGALGVPFLTAFALGIFTRFTNIWGILVGFVVTLSLGAHFTIYQTFFKPPLEPVMPVYYNDQCERVFNMTMKSSSLPSLMDVMQWHHSQGFAPQAKTPFSFDKLSYMTLPCIQFGLMVVLSSLVSVLTGGWRQEIGDEYLVPMMRKKRTKRLVTNHNQTINNLELAFEHVTGDRKKNPSVINRGFDCDV